MNETERIIKALEICTTKVLCDGCPYYGNDGRCKRNNEFNESAEVPKGLMDDVLKLLKQLT